MEVTGKASTEATELEQTKQRAWATVQDAYELWREKMGRQETLPTLLG